MTTRTLSGSPLKGARALMTGASRGIGRAIVRELARAGAGVAVIARGTSSGADGAALSSLVRTHTFFIYGQGTGERPWRRID